MLQDVSRTRRNINTCHTACNWSHVVNRWTFASYMSEKASANLQISLPSSRGMLSAPTFTPKKHPTPRSKAQGPERLPPSCTPTETRSGGIMSAMGNHINTLGSCHSYYPRVVDLHRPATHYKRRPRMSFLKMQLWFFLACSPGFYSPAFFIGSPLQ